MVTNRKKDQGSSWTVVFAEEGEGGGGEGEEEIVYYLSPWCTIATAVCLKRLPSNETTVNIVRLQR
jgi:hypothetical protein